MRTAVTAPPTEQTRAREPDRSGFVERDGVSVYWESFGAGEGTILLLPTWEIVRSRTWKCQIPYLARHFQVITFDPRGHGRSDRPADPSTFDRVQLVADAIAILDELGVELAVVVAWCSVVEMILAADHPDRVSALVEIASDVPLSPEPSDEWISRFDEVLDTDAGWARWNAPYWRRDWPGFVDFFFAEFFTEPHSTKQIEDGVAWGLETDAEDADCDTRSAPGLDRRHGLEN